MSEAKIKNPIELLVNDPLEVFHNQTTYPYGLNSNHCLLSPVKFWKIFDLQDHEEYLNSDTADRLQLRWKGCVEWDYLWGLNYNFLDSGQPSDVPSENLVREEFFSRETVTPYVAATAPFPCEVLKSNWPDLFDDEKFLMAFITIRENNGFLKEPIAFTSWEDWQPITRSLRTLRSEFKVVKIVLKEGEYLADHPDYQSVVEDEQHRMIFIRAPKGAGKTVAITKNIKGIIRAVHTRRSLAATFAELTNTPSHIKMSAQQQGESAGISTCYNSFVNLKMTPEKFDFVCDEIVQGIDTILLGGVGLDHLRVQIVNMICSHLLWSQRSWFMDADLTPNIANLIYAMYINVYNKTPENQKFYGKPNPVFFDVTREAPQKTKPNWLIYESKADVIHDKYVMDKLAKGSKLMIWIQNKREIDILKSTIEREYPDKVVKAVTSDQAASEFSEKFSKDPMTAIEEFKVDVLLHTTSIDCGVSLNRDWFDEHVLMACTDPNANAQLITQIGCRIRNPHVTRTIFLSGKDEFPDAHNWTARAGAIVEEEYRLAKHLGNLLETNMFSYDPSTGTYVYDERQVISHFFSTAYQLREQRRRNQFLTLREQLEWDQASYEFVATEIGFTAKKREANPENKERAKVIAQMPPLDAAPTDQDHPDWEFLRDKWRAQMYYGVEAAADPKIITYMLTSEQKENRLKDRRGLLKSGKVSDIKFHATELSISYNKADRREAEVLHGIASCAATIKSALRGVKTGEFLPPESHKMIEDQFNLVSFRKVLRTMDRYAPDAKDVLEPKHISGFFKRTLGIHLEWNKKNLRFFVSVKSNHKGESIIL